MVEKKNFAQQVSKITREAKSETIELLRSQGDRCFVVLLGCGNTADMANDDGMTLECHAVGLDNDGDLLIGGIFPIDGGGGYWDFDPCFRSVDDLEEVNYPEIYAFVADNLSENSYTRAEADKLLAEYEEE